MAKLSDKVIMTRKEVRDPSESKERYCIFPWPCHYFAYDWDLEKGHVMIDWSLIFSMNAFYVFWTSKSVQFSSNLKNYR